MQAADIIESVREHFSGLNLINTWGEQSFFYNPDNLLKRGMYFLTIKEKDGENDAASHLNRNGSFRINFGLSKESFCSLFNEIPGRPGKGGIIEGVYNFTQPDTLMPHPVYGWMCWVCILNPSAESWKSLMPLLSESYELVVKKYSKRKRLL